MLYDEQMHTKTSQKISPAERSSENQIWGFASPFLLLQGEGTGTTLLPALLAVLLLALVLLLVLLVLY